MAWPQRATVLIGGHIDGIKYIARHCDMYNLNSVTLIPKMPALNTIHFEAMGERLSGYLQDFKFKEQSFDVWAGHQQISINGPFNFQYGTHLYNSNNLPYVLTKTMSTHQLQWEALLNLLLKKVHPNRKMDQDNMPRVIECGIGGNFGLYMCDVFGYKSVRKEQYKWYNAGESPEYLYQHQQILVPWKERQIEIDRIITARP